MEEKVPISGLKFLTASYRESSNVGFLVILFVRSLTPQQAPGNALAFASRLAIFPSA